ncbi:virginiamycin B lyase [Nocardia sp. GAS34]|uniref:SMP-30/gluconolactonase/LRE family protein n=1 Tax=unclassified Nocardia TaxID=2637762 RepID=UPI003D1B187C
MPDMRPTAPVQPRRRIRRRRIALSCATFLTLAAAGVAGPAIARSQPVSCPRATATTVVAAGIPYVDWAENLGYDAQGNLWVSRLYRNEVQRYDRAGRITATVTVPSPGAIRLGPDRLLYVVYGDNSTNLLPGVHDSGVVRFDPTAVAPRPETFVRGLTMANGAAFDAAGNLYVADTGSGVVRVRRDATIDTAWTAQTKVFGVNGLAVDGDSVYTTVYLTGQGRILRIPIAAPSRSYPVAGLGLADDLAVGPGGFLYVATTSGHLVRVDPGGHGTCTLLTAGPMAAVATDSRGDLMVATGRGDVLRVQLDG